MGQWKQNDAARVVILLGAPGAGKDTQADLLVNELGFVQIPSSQIIEQKFAERPDDPVIAEQIRRVKAGYLNDPALTGAWIMEYVQRELSDGKALVFSGSPRTVPEGEVELAELDKLVGLQGVVAINLTLNEDIARERIKHRRFCRAHKHSIPSTPEFTHLTVCPQDGSELYVRDLDDSALLDQRFHEYHERTQPTIDLVKDSGVAFYEVDGERSIQAIHEQIVGILERHRAPVSPK